MSTTNKTIRIFESINLCNGDTEKCWEWTRSLNKSDGRPYFTVDGVKKPAYVWVLELVTGEQANGRSALHSCDNPTCCNPHHLRWGTHEENMADMVERERHGIPAIVRKAIVKLVCEEGRTQEDVAKLYGISQQSVSRICQKEQGDDVGLQQEG